MLIVGNESLAGQASSAGDANAVATISQPVSLSPSEDGGLVSDGTLTFGIIIAHDTEADVITITPSGNRTHSGKAILVTSSFGPTVFDVTGAAGASYTLVLPNNGTVTIANYAGSRMQVNNFTASAVGGTSVLGGDGKARFSVGGSLSVAAAQPNGLYTGTFPVGVNYQ